MIELNDIASNITAFINNLFILEFGADEFIDDTAIIAARLNVSPALITLLASDAEWEEVSEDTHVDSSIRKLTKIAHNSNCAYLSISIFTCNWQYHRIIHPSRSNIPCAFSQSLIFLYLLFRLIRA